MCTDTITEAAAVMDEVVSDHVAAFTAWSHDEDPSTARTPPPEPTTLDFANALSAAGLLGATESNDTMQSLPAPSRAIADRTTPERGV